MKKILIADAIVLVLCLIYSPWQLIVSVCGSLMVFAGFKENPTIAVFIAIFTLALGGGMLVIIGIMTAITIVVLADYDRKTALNKG